MAYSILFTDRSRKQFSKLNKDTQQRIIHYLESRISINPHDFGKSLVGEKKGLWRYRVDDYRIICNISNNESLILVIDVGHRREIYD
ncbi:MULTISPECIES: type II toxin-antitoxin system RelE family toxin [unclassified Candidatus Tisiphia]|uniref:Type II toxin-antitoxin system RelE/ParE family toxin n=1 Tax=Candidatus Tisiphia endosymbiont of Sergentomyia squamirostris TaxID=3113639 RepID=A0AAT9G9A6_9RICK|nr:type II toxin-antitoxin system RelE/ParE family toxin [Rickettsiaceae bacterium]